jgi:hypothetical protein
MAQKPRPPRQTPGKSALNETPAQRAWQQRRMRAFDDYRRQICTGLKFWRVCGHAQCRRKRACERDMHACFMRHWMAMPEETKVWLRAAATAAASDKRHGAAAAAGDAAVEAYRRSLSEKPRWRVTP